jgi:ATP/maltotriose-dependent transcriptional regulator MalT
VLLQRDVQLDHLTTRLAAARDGHGATVVLEGEAGIGKTAVLDAFAAQAAATGARVLRASGGELEDDVPFGVVRELFASVPPAEGAAALAAPVFRPTRETPAEDEVLHGLYWLVVGLCDAGPLVLVVDDAQWADAPSARFLAHLARRVADLPCLLVVARRPAPAAVDALGPAVALPELTTDAVQQLLQAALGGPVAAGFAAACRTATGGNPFLTVSLARELAARGVPGREDDAGVIEAIGARDVTAPVLRRVVAAGPAATDLARAVAVLGPSATVRHVCALSRVEPEAAAPVLAALVADGILADRRPLAFTHPLLRTVVLDELTSGQRGRWHAGAAALLARDGDEEEAAHHLSLAEPMGDPLAVGVLRRSAERAAARGAPDPAAAYLRRALAEPPPAHERASLLCELATTELQLGHAEEAARLLGQAVELAPDAPTRAHARELLGVATLWTRDLAEGARQLERALRDDPGQPADSPATLGLLNAGLTHVSARPLAADALRRLRARTDFGPDEQPLMAHLAAELALTSGPADRALALAERVLEGDVLLRREGLLTASQQLASLAATCAGGRDVALSGFDRAVAYARERGSAAGYGRAVTMRAWAHLRFGNLAEAEADARSALELPDAATTNAVLYPAAVGALARVTLERRGVAAGRAVLEELDDGRADPQSSPDQLLFFTRARQALSEFDGRAALAHLEACREHERGFGGDCPGYITWRPIAVGAHLILGEHDAAAELAADYRRQADAYGSPEIRGLALYASALVERDVELLRAAVVELERSPGRLLLAHVLIALGGALSADRRQVDAREPLSRALALAVESGARPMAEQARELLVAAGGRERPAEANGASDELTPTELRVVRLAIQGLTYREIAEATFVSPRTVEMHLSNSYRKLGVSGREDLASALPALA